MISILFSILVAFVVLYVVKLFIAEIPLPEPMKQIALLVVGLIALIWVVGLFGVFPGESRVFYWR